MATVTSPPPATAPKPKPGFWERCWKKPQQVWLRRAMFQIHLWAGVIVGLYIILIGVTGSILVFKEELMPRPRIDVGAVDYKACTPEKLLAIVDRVNQAYPGKAAFLTACPMEANPLYHITVRDKPKPGAPPRKRGSGPPPKQLSVYAHPHTGEILGDADRAESWVEWTEELHFDLLSGRTGRLWNGIGAAVLLALVITGMILWWPGVMRWKRALVMNFSAGWKRINWDLHSVTGFWTVFFTLMWALTGMYFTWPRLFTVPIDKVSKIVTANYPAEQMRKVAQRPASPKAPLDIAAVLQQAQVISPDGHLEGYFHGMGPKPIFTVYMARGRMGDYSNTDFIYFDEHTGQHLYTWHRGKNETLGDWLVWLVAPLHFGTSWGPVVKWIWFILGLMLPLLTITGFIMYWNRYFGVRWRKLMARA